MKINFVKVHPNASTPTRGSKFAAGYDMTSVSIEESEKYIAYDTGVALEIPEGYVGLLFPRSSVTKKDLMLKNAVGVIDPDYRGTVSFRFQRVDLGTDIYKINERVGQIVIVPFQNAEFSQKLELSSTVRGAGGYGSTGDAALSEESH